MAKNKTLDDLLKIMSTKTKKQATFRINEAMLKELKMGAKKHGLSQAKYIEGLLIKDASEGYKTLERMKLWYL
jgi:predicted DNA binding CopG/RHH family protein